MSDARRKAEDALALFDLTLDPFGAAQCVIALRALLAETARAPLAPPPAPEAHGCPVEGEPGHESCAVCGHPFPATEPPAPDAVVREAVKRLWHSLTPPRSTTDDGMLLVRAEDVEAVLRALAAPAKDEVREDVTVPPYPWTWERVARRVGEEFARTGPDGYFSFGPAEWQDWMLAQIYSRQDEVREAAEKAVNRLDNLTGAFSLPLTDAMHVNALRLALPSVSQELAEAIGYDEEDGE